MVTGPSVSLIDLIVEGSSLLYGESCKIPKMSDWSLRKVVCYHIKLSMGLWGLPAGAVL